MKTNQHFQSLLRRGFTLVELLVVMAVIATLAAMIFPAAAIIKRKAMIKRVETELKFVEAAVTAYQGNFGHYPPDNPDNFAVNQLFYELVGTTNFARGIYLTENGQAITNTSVFYGPKVVGFVNVSKDSGDEAQKARNYAIGLKPTKYLRVLNGAGAGTVLGLTDKGPLMFSEVLPGTGSINPWRYASGSATNNPGKYDLWIDVLIGGKTNRFCNWSDKPLIVY